MPEAKSGDEAGSLVRSAGAVSAATLISRILGLVREQTVAALFTRTQTDAFFIAFRIPNLLRDLFAEGAMSAAFVPTFTEQLHKKPKAEAWAFAATVITFLATLLSGIAVLGMVFAPRILAWYADDYRGVPGKFALTVSLTRVMFPFLPMVAMAAAAMGCLNASRRFFVPALAPALFNVGSIACAWLLSPLMPRWGLDPIFSLAVGTLVGGLGQFALQVPLLRKEGLKFIPRFDFGHPGVRRIATLMTPATIGLAAVQVNILVSSKLATAHGEGPVSWLQYAFRFMYLPIGLFGVAMGAAALPTMASHHARGDLPAMRRTLARGLRLLAMITVPATAGLFALAPAIVAAIYQHGRFGPADTGMTAWALRWYAVGLVAYAATKILVPAFYTLGKTAVPVTASCLSVGANVGFSLWLGSKGSAMGFQGLALATSLAAFVNAGVLYGVLRRLLTRLETRSLMAAVGKIALASAAMAVVCMKADAWLAGRLPVGVAHPPLWAQVARLAGGMGAGVVVLALVCWALRLEEFWTAVGMRRKS